MPLKVLVVDDQTSVVKVTQVNLERKKYDVISALSGQGCLDILESVTPDCIILDIKMPEMSGIQVLEEIRRKPETADISVFVMTNEDDSEKRDAALALGALGYYSKNSMNIPQIVEAIHLKLTATAVS